MKGGRRVVNSDDILSNLSKGEVTSNIHDRKFEMGCGVAGNRAFNMWRTRTSSELLGTNSELC
jgi:hypothetical protein